MVFLEFSALSLPEVIWLVIPMSAFAASVYVTNRLSSESELTVMQATGFSPWRMARPVLFFGIIIMMMMAVLSHVLVPVSSERSETAPKGCDRECLGPSFDRRNLSAPHGRRDLLHPGNHR